MIIIVIEGTFQNSGVKDYNVFHISEAAGGGGAERSQRCRTEEAYAAAALPIGPTQASLFSL